ncbi:MAG: hypothetical protein R3307_11425, partial [Anaerolineales bacterium]|nr:hypothetical protein [Anaerolineales bacterium]
MKLTKFLQFLIITSLLVTLGSSPHRPEAVTNVQPQLAQMAVEQPERLVRVIIQQFPEASGTEDRVSELGGKVVSDLHIINAFAAEMTADAALELARSGSVRWVSLDAPMESTGKKNPPA